MIKSSIIFIAFVGIAVLVSELIKTSSKKEIKPDLLVYEKKPFLFDTNSELNLYKVLLELFGDSYFIFPQINYSHLIQPKKATWEEERKYRSRIDRKSADFVMCDKERIVPLLVIELDGSAHNLRTKQTRDEFINDITNVVGLPILHLKNCDLDKEFIRKEINQKLTGITGDTGENRSIY